MADPLSAADRGSLVAEQGPINMAVGGLLIFEHGEKLTRSAIAERLEKRLHLIPRYRQRLQEPLGGGVTHPMWADDGDFDLEWHVRSETLSAGDDEELAAYVGREFSRRLDRSRPLWELHVISGLAGGRTALMPKMHHALVDGIAAIDVGTVLLDPTPEPLEVAAPEDSWSPRPFDRRRQMTRIAATPFVRTQKLLLNSATRALEMSPKRATEELRRATGLLGELARSRPQAPMTPLNRRIGPNRRYAKVRTELGDVKRIGKAAGATVNDVLLAAVTGMLARYLDGGELGGASPVALVPVSVRREDERGETGNRISTVFVDLPVAEPDTRERIRLIHTTMQGLKESAAVRAGSIIVGATGIAPPLVSSMIGRATAGIRAMNLVVSNVPGPQQPFYVSGSQLQEAYPVVPLNPANQGLTVGILSYDGGVHFGLLADRELDPPVDRAAADLREALDELTAAA